MSRDSPPGGAAGASFQQWQQAEGARAPHGCAPEPVSRNAWCVPAGKRGEGIRGVGRHEEPVCQRQQQRSGVQPHCRLALRCPAAHPLRCCRPDHARAPAQLSAGCLHGSEGGHDGGGVQRGACHRGPDAHMWASDDSHSHVQPAPDHARPPTCHLGQCSVNQRLGGGRRSKPNAPQPLLVCSPTSRRQAEGRRAGSYKPEEGRAT